MVYSIQERVEIVSLYLRNNDCARAAARVFNENSNKTVSAKYVLELVAKFRETGSVQNIKRNQVPIAEDEALQITVLGHVQMNNMQSVRKLSEVSGIAKSTVHNILKKTKFHPYKIQLLQELNEDDPDRRLQFCEILTELIRENPHLLYNICFSDECSFYLNGEVNRHNCRYWSDENPHVYRECYTQYPQKLNVWVGLLGDHIIGPFFIEGNLNGAKYLELLDNHIDPMITNILEQDDNLLENQLVFQQDGAPPHFVVPVREFLNNRFPGRWIGRRGPTEWPPRSPDLSPLDFFLWGHLKSVIYATQPTSLEDLRNRIIQSCRAITPEIFHNVRKGFEQRLYYCMEVGGGHFQQFVR